VLVSASTSVFALDYFVGTTEDTNDGLCTPVGAPIQMTCSLREAVIKANGIAGEDTIYLANDVYELTIVGAGDDTGATGDLDVYEDVNIVGGGMFATRIAGFTNEPVFDMRFAPGPPFPRIQVYDMTLSNARTGIAGLRADVYLWRVLIVDCANVGVGVNEGLLFLADSEIRGLNDAYMALNISDGDLFMTRSTIADNTITPNSGAIICFFSNASIINSTISGNSASGGQTTFGGFHGTNCNTSIDSSTIIENEPYEIAVDQALPGTTTLRNNYIHGPCPFNAQGLLTSQGGNVGGNTYSDQYCGLNHPTDQVVPGDPLVLPLGFFGGFTQTRLPKGIGFNPLVDNPDADAHCQGTDQRHVVRPQDGGGAVVACDTGAVERKPGDYTHFWGDGFESGDTSAWDVTHP